MESAVFMWIFLWKTGDRNEQIHFNESSLILRSNEIIISEKVIENLTYEFEWKKSPKILMYLTEQYIKKHIVTNCSWSQESKNASVFKKQSKSYMINRPNLKIYIIISVEAVNINVISALLHR